MIALAFIHGGFRGGGDVGLVLVGAAALFMGAILLRGGDK
jgi:hypothetical protein